MADGWNWCWFSSAGRVPLLLLSFFVSGGALPPLVQTDALNLSPQAAALHARSIVIDTHCDTTQRLLGNHFNFGARQTDGHLDLPRLREGGVGAAFLAIWVRGNVTGQTAVDRALEQIDLVTRQVAAHSSEL